MKKIILLIIIISLITIVTSVSLVKSSQKKSNSPDIEPQSNKPVSSSNESQDETQLEKSEDIFLSFEDHLDIRTVANVSEGNFLPDIEYKTISDTTNNIEIDWNNQRHALTVNIEKSGEADYYFTSYNVSFIDNTSKPEQTKKYVTDISEFTDPNEIIQFGIIRFDTEYLVVKIINDNDFKNEYYIYNEEYEELAKIVEHTQFIPFIPQSKNNQTPFGNSNSLGYANDGLYINDCYTKIILPNSNESFEDSESKEVHILRMNIENGQVNITTVKTYDTENYNFFWAMY